MTTENTSQIRIKKSAEFYKNLKSSLKGLSDIINLQYEKEHFLYQAAADNLIALAKNIPELLNLKKSSKIINSLREVNFSVKCENKKSELAK